MCRNGSRQALTKHACAFKLVALGFLSDKSMTSPFYMYCFTSACFANLLI